MSIGNGLDFEKVFDTSPDIHCACDASGVIEYVNGRMFDLLGWGEQEVVGRSLFELLHEDDQVKVVLGGSRELPASRYRHRDGSWLWLEWSMVELGAGRVYGIGRDVTVRVKHEREASRQQRLLEASMRLSKSGYFMVDIRAQSVFWSEGIYTIHGLRSEVYEPTLEEAIDFYHPEDRAKVSAHMAHSVERREPFEFQLRLIRANDGEERLVHSLGIPFLDDAGEVIEIFGIFRDITDDISVVRQEELEQFSYMASHDLKEPLRLLRVYLGLCEEALQDVDHTSIKEYWGRVMQSATRMDALVADLSRYVMAGQRVELRPVALERVLSEALKHVALKHTFDASRVHLAENFPIVLGNHQRLVRAFTQLLLNAFQFGREEVNVSWLDMGSHVEVCVRDDGPGFDARYQDKIFRPFQKLNHEEASTGMGLAIVKRIVQQCDGRIRAESQPGKGAAFYVSFLLATGEQLLEEYLE